MSPYQPLQLAKAESLAHFEGIRRVCQFSLAQRPDPNIIHTDAKG
jgi:hypothetical protein